jgi:thiosulfate/3-mercaptopyruvate sulfurtransferase
MDPVVTNDQLASSPSALVADVRWYLDGRSGRAAYEAGHLPGAVFVDLDRDLADHSQAAVAGRHPLPTPEVFAAAMSRCGIGDDTPVIAYDDSGGATAGRLVFMLRVLGHDAALLDGGLAAWSGDVETGPGRMPPALAFTPKTWPAERFASAEEVAALARSGRGAVLDARGADRFRGETEPVDPRAGHVPGARNAPWAENLDPSGRYRDPDALGEHYAAFGARPGADVICYCGSGVSACADLLGLERAGVEGARLYVASWSGWSSDPTRPVATGG